MTQPHEIELGMAGRLGNVIYWFCSGFSIIAAIVGVFMLYVIEPQYEGYADGFMLGVSSIVGGMMIYLIGRAVRYVLTAR